MIFELLGRLEVLLDQAAWSLASGLMAAPIWMLAVAVGLLAWRGRRPIAGVIAALAVQAAASADAWGALVHTVSLVWVVALAGSPVAIGVGCVGRELMERFRVARRDVPVVGALLVVSAPLAITVIVIPTDQAWIVAATLVAASATGVAFGVLDDAWRWPTAITSALLMGFAVVVLTGLLGGPGIGGVLRRTVPTQEVRVAADLLVALGAAGIGLAAVVQPLRAASSASGQVGPPAGGADPAPGVQRDQPVQGATS